MREGFCRPLRIKLREGPDIRRPANFPRPKACAPRLLAINAAGFTDCSFSIPGLSASRTSALLRHVSQSGHQLTFVLTLHFAPQSDQPVEEKVHQGRGVKLFWSLVGDSRSRVLTVEGIEDGRPLLQRVETEAAE